MLYFTTIGRSLYNGSEHVVMAQNGKRKVYSILVFNGPVGGLVWIALPHLHTEGLSHSRSTSCRSLSLPRHDPNKINALRACRPHPRMKGHKGEKQTTKDRHNKRVNEMNRDKRCCDNTTLTRHPIHIRSMRNMYRRQSNKQPFSGGQQVHPGQNPPKGRKGHSLSAYATSLCFSCMRFDILETLLWTRPRQMNHLLDRNAAGFDLRRLRAHHGCFVLSSYHFVTCR